MTTYEPGTVAVATVRGIANKVVVRCASEHLSPCWFVPTYTPSENHNGWWPDDEEVTDIRPLVVIDPEDREQVERLARVTHIAMTGDVPAWSTLSGKDQVRRMDALAMALHAEANPTPPKPEEPTGLGAVVEDAEGVRWVLIPGDAAATSDPRPRWFCSHSTARWSSIAAVRVLSTGVTP